MSEVLRGEALADQVATRNHLPWESHEGDPAGVGICLSGGGLRSAAFSLGALEALQEKRGLLLGPNSAEYLAAVSGGAYISATAFLNMPTESGGAPPLLIGSPESKHVINNGRYLVDQHLRSVWPVLWRMVLSWTASILLVTWVGFIMADIAVLVDRYLPIPRIPGGPLLYAAAGGMFAAIGALGASQQTDRIGRSYLLIAFGFPLLLVTAPSFLAALSNLPWLSTPSWWKDHSIISGIVITSYGLASAAPFVLPRLRRIANLVAKNTSRLALFVVACWVIAAFEGPTSRVLAGGEASAADALLVFGPLLGGLVASYVHDVTSLHRPYRDFMSRCFAIRRTPEGSVKPVAPPTSASLSALVPPQIPAIRHPRILVCATANIYGFEDEAALFVFSHDRSGLAGTPDAAFTTRQLELGRARSSVLGRRREPEVSLMDSVAMTAAAFTPTMGSITSAGARPLIALLNFRLGQWLPNPLSPARRDVVEMRPRRPLNPRRRSEHGRLGPGASALLGELLGSHSRNARRIYVTDGGHYDNLGLIALLRARCKEIWCVDAYSNRKRLGRQLSKIIELAERDLNIAITIDVDRFSLLPGSDSVAHFAFARGAIHYPGNSEPGTITVVKLAITPTTPPALVTYRSEDSRFPYHTTFIQWYGHARFEAYRALGHFHTSEAVDAL